MAAAAVGALIAVGGAALDFSSSKKAAKRKKKAEQKRYRQIKAANEAMLREAALTTRVSAFEQRTQISAQIGDVREQARQAAGVSRVSAAGRGVRGRSVEDLQLDIETGRVEQEARLSKFQDFRESAAIFRLRSLKLKADARLAAGLPGPAFKPNEWAAGLSIISAGFQGAALGQQVGDTFK